MSDGSVDPRRYTISFTESKEVVNEIIKKFKEIEGIKLKWRTEKQSNSVRARTYSGDLINLLFKYSPSFRNRRCNLHPKCSDGLTCKKCEPIILNGFKYPQVIIPQQIFKSNILAKNFLRYYITCDGGPIFNVYIRKNRIIQLSSGIKIGCSSLILKKQLVKLLDLIEIKNIEVRDGIEIKKLSELKKFHKKIGFLNSSKVRRSKFVNGIKKNTIVKFSIICKARSKKSYWINSNFKTKKEFELNLRNELLKLDKE